MKVRAQQPSARRSVFVAVQERDAFCASIPEILLDLVPRRVPARCGGCAAFESVPTHRVKDKANNQQRKQTAKLMVLETETR